jgi:hypothetical protein
MPDCYLMRVRWCHCLVDSKILETAYWIGMKKDVMVIKEN